MKHAEQALWKILKETCYQLGFRGIHKTKTKQNKKIIKDLTEQITKSKMYSSTAKVVQSLDLNKRCLSAVSQESMCPHRARALSSAHASKVLTKWSQAHLRTYSGLFTGFDFPGGNCLQMKVWTDLVCRLKCLLLCAQVVVWCRQIQGWEEGIQV